MKNVIGKPQTLKQVNLAVVRKAIKENESATRAEIVNITKISVTTVRTLLTEMLENNEIVDIGFDESIGGRRAVRYKLNKERFFGVALCLARESIHYLIVNICGEICESGTFAIKEENTTQELCSFLDALSVKLEIKSIGLGVPGIVNGLTYQRKDVDGKLTSYSIGEHINQRYNVPVILENDINAIAFGLGRRHLMEHPNESCTNIHIAYLHFANDCLSAGFLSNGRILRGKNNFVGELGMFPVSEAKTLDEILSAPLEKHQYSDIVAKLISLLCCVLNPQYIAIGGEAFRKECLPLIMKQVKSGLPDKMLAEIIFEEDNWQDYYNGMAYLTAENIFSDMQIVKGWA